MVKEFNGSNQWTKRGISKLPIVVEVMRKPTPGAVSILWDGSVVVEVGGVEIGQGLYTKVKQMAAFCLGLIQCEGIEDLVDKVRVSQTDSLSLVQGGLTSGCTTSEMSCEAVRICCSILVERLKPLKENLQKQSGLVDWKKLIYQARLTNSDDDSQLSFVDNWLDMHIEDAETILKKPLLLAEFGKSQKDPGFSTVLLDLGNESHTVASIRLKLWYFRSFVYSCFKMGYSIYEAHG